MLELEGMVFVKVVVKHRHDRSFADSEKFAVNGDFANPVWLMRAITRAKVESMEALFDNRSPVSTIASSETGEVLYQVSCDNNLRTLVISGIDLVAEFERCG